MQFGHLEVLARECKKLAVFLPPARVGHQHFAAATARSSGCAEPAQRLHERRKELRPIDAVCYQDEVRCRLTVVPVVLRYFQ